MADTVLSFLLENLAEVVKQEFSTFVGVRDGIATLDVELMFINHFLQSSKGKREKVKNLIGTIQALAYGAEDVIDTFVINLAKYKRRTAVGKFFKGMNHVDMIRTVSTDAKSIISQINTIYSKMEEYGIEKSEASMQDDYGLERRTTLNKSRCRVEEDDVVSFVKNLNEVKKMLNKTDRRLDVVSIIGMGGLGKTTLARQVYNDVSVKKRFDCCAWINVSQDFDTKELLLNILKKIAESMEGLNEMSEEELANSVVECLKRTIRYLIVLDDVWSSEVWEGIKVAFPDNMTGCRILITSRVTNVALNASKSPPYMLPALDKDEAWLLLSKKAFRGDKIPEELEEDGRKIVEKCQRLPLALVVVGGLLATKDRTTRVWSDVSNNLKWYLNQNLESCLDILALSYEELPPHLKLCFLYFGGFPEDFEISARRLIKLWIAEGFIITKDETRKLEDIAEIYLENLIDRNLIMVATRRSDGGVKSCMIHDLLRDLCISEGLKENFLTVHNTTTTTAAKPRRLSILCSTSMYLSSIPCDPSLDRTLLCFGDPDRLSDDNFRSLYKGFRLLRVLDFGSTIVMISIPTQIEKLIHLRYLRINAPKLTEIPSCISKLPNLQTLDLRESSIKYLTSNFWKMQQLRHLFVCGDCSLQVMQNRKDIKTMPNLQTLSTLSSNAVYVIDGNKIFPNLTKVGLRASKLPAYTNTGTSRTNYKSVASLKIVEGSHFLLHRGALSSNLTKLTLVQTRIRLPVLEMLAKLPNLEILKLLKKSLAEVSFECGKGWFPKLQVLHMVELDLKEWDIKGGLPTGIDEAEQKLNFRKLHTPMFSKEYCIEHGTTDYWPEWEEEVEMLEEVVREKWKSYQYPEAMVSLRYLYISKCRDLIKVPGVQLRMLNKLRHVKASWCAPNLESRLREAGDNVNYEIQTYN